MTDLWQDPEDRPSRPVLDGTEEITVHIPELPARSDTWSGWLTGGEFPNEGVYVGYVWYGEGPEQADDDPIREFALFEPPPRIMPPDGWFDEQVDAVEDDMAGCTCARLRVAVVRYPPTEDSPTSWSFVRYGHSDDGCPEQDPDYSSEDDDDQRGQS